MHPHMSHEYVGFYSRRLRGLSDSKIITQPEHSIESL